MSVTTKTIKPGGGGDYSSLGAFITGEEGALGVDEILIAECYKGADDTADVKFSTSAFTFAAGSKIIVKAAAGSEAQVPWVTSTDAYVLYPSGSVSCAAGQNIEWYNIQIQRSGATNTAVFVRHHYASGCHIRFANAGNANKRWVMYFPQGTTENCVIEADGNATSASRTQGGAYLFNTIAIGTSGRGFLRGNGTATFFGNLVYDYDNNGDWGWSGSPTSGDYNASFDATGPGSNTLDNIADPFVGGSTGNYRTTSTGHAVEGACIHPVLGGIYNWPNYGDFDGKIRSPFGMDLTMGAFELEDVPTDEGPYVVALAGSTSSSAAVSMPFGDWLEEDDVILAWFTMSNDFAITTDPVAPDSTSFTAYCAELSIAAGDDRMSDVAYFVAGADEGYEWGEYFIDWVLNNTAPARTYAMVIRGSDPADPFDVTPSHANHHTSGENDNAPQCGNLTTVSENVLILEWTYLSGNGASAIASDSTDATELAKEPGGHQHLATLFRKSTAGARTGATHTYTGESTTGDWMAFCCAIKGVSASTSTSGAVVEGLDLGESFVGLRTAPAAPSSEGLAMGDVFAATSTRQVAWGEGLVLSDAPEARADMLASWVDGLALGDTLTASASMGVAWTAEGLVLGESFLAQATFLANLLEGLELGDSVRGEGTLQAAVAEVLELGDTWGVERKVYGAIVDGLALGDVASARATIQAALASEVLLLGDTVDAVRKVGAQVVEALLLGESLRAEGTFLANLAEGLQLSDSWAVAAGIQAAISDSLQLGDSWAAHRVVAAALLEALQLGDTFAAQGILQAAVAEGLSLADAFRVVATVRAELGDTLLLGGAFGGDRSVAGQWAEELRLGDALAVQATIQAALVEGLQLSDTSGVLATMLAIMAEGMSLGDAWTAIVSVGVQAVLVEGMALGDSWEARATLQAALVEGLLLGDTEAATATVQASWTEGLGLGDAPVGIEAYLRELTEGLALGDLYEFVVRHQGYFAEGLSLGDAYQVAVTVLAAESDTLTLGEAFAAVVTTVAQVVEGLKLGDSYVAALRFVRLIEEGLDLGDIFTGTQKAQLVTTEGLELGDAWAAAQALGGSIVEGLALGDTWYYGSAPELLAPLGIRWAWQSHKLSVDGVRQLRILVPEDEELDAGVERGMRWMGMDRTMEEG